MSQLALPAPAHVPRLVVSSRRQFELSGDAWFVLWLCASILGLVASLIVLGAPRTGLVMIIVIVPAVVVLAFTNTERALMVYFVYCSVEGVFKTMTSYSAITHIGRDLVLAVVVAGAAVRCVLQGGRLEWDAPNRRLMLLFAAVCAVQVFNPQSLGLIPSIAALRFHIYALPVYFIAYRLIRTKPAMERWCWLSLGIGALLSLVAVLQYVKGLEWTNAVFPGSATYAHDFYLDVKGFQQAWRPPSTVGDGGGGANWVVVAVPFLFAVATFRKARGWSLLLLPPAALLMVINLVASSVRQMAILTIICAVLMVVLLVVRVQRGSALPAIAGIGLAAFAAWQISLAGNALATARFSILQNPVQAYQAQRAHNLSSITEDLQNYVFGAGLGRTGPAAVQFADAIQAHPLDGPVPLTGFMNAETYFAGMNSETGVPGLLLILAITALFIVRGAHAYWTARDPHLRAVAAAFLVLLIALSVSYWGGPTLYTPPFNIFFWLAGGILARVPELDRQLAISAAAPLAALP